MPRKSGDSKNRGRGAEPVLIIKPVANGFGIDYLHITLLVLVVILIGFAFVLSTFKQGVLVENCTYGQYNGTCVTPAHNASQALAAAERVLAGYSLVNSSLDILPYYSIPNRSTVSYLQNSSQWLVVMPYVDPLAGNSTFYFAILLKDSNLSLVRTYTQTVRPALATKNQVVAQGVVSIYGRSACYSAGSEMPVYAFIDPYAPGAIQGILDGINASQRFGSSINLTYKFVATGYTDRLVNGYGAAETGALDQGIWCASQQPARFKGFIENLSLLYSGAPLPQAELQSTAAGSGLNVSAFNSCMQNSTQVLEFQAQLANLYGVQNTPTYVLGCEYQTIPQTLDQGISYALSHAP